MRLPKKGMIEFIDLTQENDEYKYDVKVEEWYEEGQLKKCSIFITKIS